MSDVKAGRAARGIAYLALTCLLAAALLIVRFRRPPQILVEAMPGQDSRSEMQNTDEGAKEARFPEGYQKEALAEMPKGVNTEDAGDDAGLFVHVAGCVTKPGLYELKPGARVNDALLAAGGMTKSADSDSVNIALPLRDGQQVYIPIKAAELQVNGTEAAGSPQGSRQDASDSQRDSPEPAPPDRLDVTKDAPDEEGALAEAAPAARVDINSAGLAELDTLPGIGPSTAAKIIEYRQSNGPFVSTEQLMDVSGIGPAKYEAIREMVVAGR